MHLAIAQLDMTVGDIDGNVERALAAISAAEARGATITLLPELAVTGYPPEDLLHMDHFVEDNLLALERIASACRHLVLAGFVDRTDAGLHNAIAVCGNARVLHVYHKRHLPNYGVFDERRYFEPGTSEGLMEIAGELFGLTICEDIWIPEPAAQAAAAGARLVLNLSASPFHAGKADEREETLCRRARENSIWLAYCNLVGGQDELIFDGRSVVVSPEGEVVARAASFEEDLISVEFSTEGRLGASAHLSEPLSENEEIYAALALGLSDYVKKNGFADVVIGLSGGIDSALTATVASDSLGPERVHGVMMPSAFSSPGSLEDARDLAERLGIDLLELPIEPAVAALREALHPALRDGGKGVTDENLQARTRGALLMALSNEFGWLVLATGNKSELSVGYSTLYGDMVGGFAPLKDVFKTRVYDLARWRNSRSEVIPAATIEKEPSAELRPGQTDQDSLPAYGVLDGILSAYVESAESRQTIAGLGYDPEVVEAVCGMVDAAEYKRRQGPLGIKISPRAFGRDRRMPITNAYGR